VRALWCRRLQAEVVSEVRSRPPGGRRATRSALRPEGRPRTFTPPTGLRQGELCGLRRGDLEPIQGTLTMRRQLVVEDPGSRLRVKPPKSHNGERTLVLDPITPRSADGGRGEADAAVLVHRAYGSAVAAGQSQGPVQPARLRGGGPADWSASDSAFDCVESA
jgi:hypothetical protein